MASKFGRKFAAAMALTFAAAIMHSFAAETTQVNSSTPWWDVTLTNTIYDIGSQAGLVNTNAMTTTLGEYVKTGETTNIVQTVVMEMAATNGIARGEKSVEIEGTNVEAKVVYSEDNILIRVLKGAGNAKYLRVYDLSEGDDIPPPAPSQKKVRGSPLPLGVGGIAQKPFAYSEKEH